MVKGTLNRHTNQGWATLSILGNIYSFAIFSDFLMQFDRSVARDLALLDLMFVLV